MRLCELRQKEVINCRDGERLGFVCDVDFDIHTCQLLAIIVPGPCKIFGILGRDHEFYIDIQCIRQIGADVILVDVDIDKVFVKSPFC